MMVDDIVRAPQPRHGRHRDQYASARRQLAGERAQRGHVFRNMFQHIEQNDQVIMAVFQRHAVRQIAALDREAAALFGERARAIVGLDRIDIAISLQQRQVGPGAAADLEDLERPCLRTIALDQPRYDLAAGGEPPVIGVDFRHAIISRAIHQACSSMPIQSRTI